MSIIRRDTYKRGSWLAVSDLDGMKRKSTDMRMMWNNAWVGREEWNEIQPQQIIRARRDNPARNPVRNVEPITQNMTQSQQTTTVYSSTGVPYVVSTVVLSSAGASYVVASDVETSSGGEVPIFAYDFAEIGQNTQNVCYVGPPITPSQMI